MNNVHVVEITREGMLDVGLGKTIDEERGGWIQVHNGDPFFILTPRPEDIDIQLIAQGLAKTCRFNGQTKDHKTFVSVAAHSVHVSLYKPELFPKEKLLHDAEEAFVSDIVRPLKRILPDFSEVSDRLQKVIFERFGLEWPLPMEVLEADNVILATEKRDFLAPSKAEWIGLPDPLPEPLVSMGPTEAYHYFLDRFEELFNERVVRK